MTSRDWQRFRDLVDSPMGRILLLLLAVRVVGVGWGLPASDGWDTDGIAPRDFFPGLAATFTPGHYFTYPPLHLALLAILTLPVALVAVIRAPSFSLPDVIGEILKVPYMTSIAYVARAVSLVMSLGIVLFVARIAEESRACELGLAAPETSPRSRWLDGDWTDERVRRAGWCCAVVVGLNATLTYYAHTTNLDVAYLFWATWSLSLFARAIGRRQPRLLRHAFALAVLAVGTKDQAYAVFIVALPIMYLLWVGLDRSLADGRGAEILKETAKSLAIAFALFLVVDAVVFNPTGFKARLAFLTGPASKDFVEYTADWPGRLKIVSDAARYFELQYPKLLSPLIALGGAYAIGSALRAPAPRRGGRLALALLPVLVAVSFTVTFNWASLRSNARFLLPQALMLGIYAGRALDLVLFARRPLVRWAGRVAAAVPLGLALYACVCVDVNLLYDPRHDAEAWLNEHVRPGETIETYGLNVYLPRFPPQAKVVRVGPEPIGRRNPLPPLTEVEAAFDRAPSREARYIVLSFAWGWRYLIQAHPSLASGDALAPTQYRTASDEAASQWFETLVAGKGAFGVVHESMYALDRWFPIVDVHGATGRPISIYGRK